ncbi:GMP synthase [glutamine-hydrolyzing] [Aquimixticola soesokkakensis]|uniref:GMP synthase [glutamine-hydrolyzing] n=1 Tax=Aquimixticola soesokkakensis TaxID=1519096 RepID=A0A1Y5S561_9RHOB|nr:type 1 glutamine amidotransferase [Aquimixticola soesokkakensis]SLN31951.1 GMP synthase [glutamine-hydrolyzing] [Aquimixticola soesokkakensis]
MKIGILQCGHTPEAVARLHGDFDVMFQTLFAGEAFDWQVFNIVDMDFPSGPEAADAWLLTGSRHGAYEDHAFIPPLEQLIRDIHASGKRMLGICFGHQIVAQALGGRVEKFAGGWSVGRTAYEFEGLGEVQLNAWHQDQVVALPQGARVIGRNDFCANAALVYGDSILTVQAHPEFSTAIIGDYLAARGDDPAYPEAIITAARATQDAPVDGDKIAQLMAQFLTQERAPA